MRGVLMISVIVPLVVMISLSLEITNSERALGIFEETGFPNTVTAVYLKNRVYDTVFEVLVFSCVVSGVSAFYRGGEKGADRIADRIFSTISGFVAFTIGAGSIYLALTGHVYPGGGFTAGVAGGTALLLFGMRMGIEAFEENFERFKVETVEKMLVIAVVVVALLEMWGFLKEVGVPLQSFLIYLKVMGGTWIIVYNFVKHRGIV